MIPPPKNGGGIYFQNILQIIIVAINITNVITIRFPIVGICNKPFFISRIDVTVVVIATTISSIGSPGNKSNGLTT